MLNRQWLRSFSVLAETGSFTRSAERLGLTQAAVSQHVQHLERALGPVFIRRPRRLELTPAGAALLAHCQELQGADERLQRRLSEREAVQGVLGIVTPGSIGLALYPVLLDLQQARPGLVIRHRFAPDHEVLESVLEGRYELGLTTRRPDDARLAATSFVEEPLELVLPAGAQVRDWSGLVELGFIDHPDGQAMAARLLSRHFPGAPGVQTLPCHGFINQIGLILEPVARGLGFTVLPRYAREAFAHQDRIGVMRCEIPVLDTLHFVHRAEWPPSARAQVVMGYLMGRDRVAR
jgi:DNA-binding transcriptional LysR family regulator